MLLLRAPKCARVCCVYIYMCVMNIYICMYVCTYLCIYSRISSSRSCRGERWRDGRRDGILTLNPTSRARNVAEMIARRLHFGAAHNTSERPRRHPQRGCSTRKGVVEVTLKMLSSSEFSPRHTSQFVEGVQFRQSGGAPHLCG